MHLEAEATELPGDEARRLALFEAELGIGMYAMTPGNDLGSDARGRIIRDHLELRPKMCAFYVPMAGRY
jgi:hypothetical protein